MSPVRVSRLTGALFAVVALFTLPGRGWSAAEVKLDRDFLSGVVEKVPPCPFQKEGRYRGTVQAFRLLAIDPKARRFLVACQVAGEFRPPLAKPRAEGSLPGGHSPERWKKFRFDVRAGVNIEPGIDGTPRFRVEVEEVKRRELEGFAGALAKVLGRSFDAMARQVADGKASQMNQKLNAEVLKRVKAFQEYGVFCGIDYAPEQVVLRFDVSRYRPEGVAGYVFPTAQPGTVPLYRWVRRGWPDRLYTTSAFVPDPRLILVEGVACFVFDHPAPGTVPLYRWRGRGDHFYTTAADGEGALRFGYRPEGVACFVFPTARPGTVPLYRFIDPRVRLHFYSTHPHAEFAK